MAYATGVAAAALGVSGCSDAAQFGATGSPAAFLKKVVVAMDAQPRMIIEMAGGSINRAVIDTNAQYLALFSSGKLLVLQKAGRQYREQTGCYRAVRPGRIRTDSLWAGVLDDITGGRYSVTVSGTSVVYRSSQGKLTIDSGTDLIRSARTVGLPSGGVSPTRAMFSYPGSVVQLPAPRHVCP